MVFETIAYAVPPTRPGTVNLPDPPVRPVSGRDLLAEVGRTDPVVGEQLLARAGEHDLAGLQDVAAAGQPQGLGGVLLDDQHGDSLGVDLPDDVEDLPDDQRG